MDLNIFKGERELGDGKEEREWEIRRKRGIKREGVRKGEREWVHNMGRKGRGREAGGGYQERDRKIEGHG